MCRKIELFFFRDFFPFRVPSSSVTVDYSHNTAYDACFAVFSDYERTKYRIVHVVVAKTVLFVIDSSFSSFTTIKTNSDVACHIVYSVASINGKRER